MCRSGRGPPSGGPAQGYSGRPEPVGLDGIVMEQRGALDPWQVGHRFGEGVYQFWITPEDLADRLFDRVVLTRAAH